LRISRAADPGGDDVSHSEEEALAVAEKQRFKETASQSQGRAFKQDDADATRLITMLFTPEIPGKEPGYLSKMIYTQEFKESRTNTLMENVIQKFGRPDRMEPVRYMSSFTLYYIEDGDRSAPIMTVLDNATSGSLTLELEWPELQQKQQKAFGAYALEQANKRPAAQPKF
jgi:hypothetical protein